MSAIYTSAIRPNEVYLSHYGRKGMKWGMHIFTNPDGSLNALGKARLGKSIKFDKRSGQYVKMSRQERKIAKTKAKVAKIEKIAKAKRAKARLNEREKNWEEKLKKAKSENNELDAAKKEEIKKSGADFDGDKAATEPKVNTEAKASSVVSKASEREEAKRDREIAKGPARKMSDEHLSKAIDRLSQEKKYRELKAETGAGRVKKILADSGATALSKFGTAALMGLGSAVVAKAMMAYNEQNKIDNKNLNPAANAQNLFFDYLKPKK